MVCRNVFLFTYFDTTNIFFQDFRVAEWYYFGICYYFLFEMLFVPALAANFPKLAHEKNNKLAYINKLSVPLSVGIDGLWINWQGFL